MIIWASQTLTGAARKEAQLWEQVRNEALDLAYMVEGYEDLPLAEKNKIYDTFRGAVAARYNLA